MYNTRYVYYTYLYLLPIFGIKALFAMSKVTLYLSDDSLKGYYCISCIIHTHVLHGTICKV